MVKTDDRAQRAAQGLLHRLLDHHKQERGLAPKDRVEPEDFFPVNIQVLLQLEGWTFQAVADVGYTVDSDPLAAKYNQDEKTIFVLRTLPQPVQRYSVAHELGHVLLHTDPRGPRVLSMLSARDRRSTAAYSAQEREAEVFARELLMPPKAIHKHFCQLFGVDRLRVSSPLACRFAPRAHQKRPATLRAVADELANWSDASPVSMTAFFNVSTRAMSNRLIELYHVHN